MTVGEVLVLRYWDLVKGDRDTIRIARADPVILVTDELMHRSPIARIEDGRPYLEVDGDRLVLRDDFGAEFIYRIGAYDQHLSAWRCEWPD